MRRRYSILEDLYCCDVVIKTYFLVCGFFIVRFCSSLPGDVSPSANEFKSLCDGVVSEATMTNCETTSCTHTRFCRTDIDARCLGRYVQNKVQKNRGSTFLYPFKLPADMRSVEY